MKKEDADELMLMAIIKNTAPIIVTDDPDTGELTMTFREIYDALAAGKPVYYKYVYGDNEYVASARLSPIVAAYRYSDFLFRVVATYPARTNQTIGTLDASNYVPGTIMFVTSSIDGHPKYKQINHSSNNSWTADRL